MIRSENASVHGNVRAQSNAVRLSTAFASSLLRCFDVVKETFLPCLYLSLYVFFVLSAVLLSVECDMEEGEKGWLDLA